MLNFKGWLLQSWKESRLLKLMLINVVLKYQDNNGIFQSRIKLIIMAVLQLWFGYPQTCIVTDCHSEIICPLPNNHSNESRWRGSHTEQLLLFRVIRRRWNEEFVLPLFCERAKHNVHNLFQAISCLRGLEACRKPAQWMHSQPHHNFVTYSVCWQYMSCCIICRGWVWAEKANKISWCMYLFCLEWMEVFRNGLVSQWQ